MHHAERWAPSGRGCGAHYLHISTYKDRGLFHEGYAQPHQQGRQGRAIEHHL